MGYVLAHLQIARPLAGVGEPGLAAPEHDTQATWWSWYLCRVAVARHATMDYLITRCGSSRTKSPPHAREGCSSRRRSRPPHAGLVPVGELDPCGLERALQRVDRDRARPVWSGDLAVGHVAQLQCSGLCASRSRLGSMRK